MARKTGLFRGLCFVTAFLFALSGMLGMMLERFRQQVDETLGTTSQVIVSNDEGSLWTAFTPPAEVLKEDGSLDTRKAIERFLDFSGELAAGGTVLLKNENGALPIASGSSVTLLGMKSHYPILASGQGMPIVGAVITLEDALSKNRTDFRNPDRNVSRSNIKPPFDTFDDFDFEGGGLRLNPVAINAYEAYNKSLDLSARFTYIPPMSRFDTKESLHFDDPAVAKLQELSPGLVDSFAEYGDAAIVVVGRPSSENGDYRIHGAIKKQGNTEPLELTNNERDIIAFAGEHFDKVIVVVNCVNPMELSEVQNNDKVDAVLWIGHPGSFGMLGVSDVLTGKVNPSGGLPDTFAAKNLSAPAMVNFGNYKYTNCKNNGDPETQVVRRSSANYVVEAESIYVG